MIKALFYKEWIKTRGAFTCMLTIGIGILLYIHTGVENKITMQGAKNIMLRVLYDEPPYVFYRAFQYIPLLTALAISLTQYLPEVLQRRIRLTLHLPMKNNALIIAMILYGTALLTVANIVYGGVFLYCNCQLFPREIVLPVMRSVLPWVLGSYTAYNFIAMVAMEPARLRRLLYAVVGWYVVRLFMVDGDAPGAYDSSLALLTVLAMLSSGLVLYSSRRFYKGEA